MIVYKCLVNGRIGEPARQRVREGLQRINAERFGVPVTVSQNPRGRGKLVIAFDNHAQLQQVLKLLR